MEKKDILIVEDNPEIIEIIRAFYSLLPYTYTVVNSGEEALEIIKDTTFKVYVLDINLGDNKMHGVDLAITIRRSDKLCKIYALTGHLGLFDTIEPQIAGFNKVFYKTIGYKALLDQIVADLKSLY